MFWPKTISSGLAAFSMSAIARRASLDDPARRDRRREASAEVRIRVQQALAHALARRSPVPGCPRDCRSRCARRRPPRARGSARAPRRRRSVMPRVSAGAGFRRGSRAALHLRDVFHEAFEVPAQALAVALVHEPAGRRRRPCPHAGRRARRRTTAACRACAGRAATRPVRARVPRGLGDAPMTPTTRLRNTRAMSLDGRDSQSIAFFATPGIELLYSGVTISSAWFATMRSLSACTAARNVAPRLVVAVVERDAPDRCRLDPRAGGQPAPLRCGAARC